MTKKTIVEQIKDTQIKLEKARTEQKQKERQLEKLKKQERAKEHKIRTRRLIEKGAILESIDPNLAQLDGEYLKECLQIIFTNHNIQQIVKNNLILQQRQH